MNTSTALRLLVVFFLALGCLRTSAQNPTPSPRNPPEQLPDAPAKPLSVRPPADPGAAPLTPAQIAEKIRISKLAIINGRPYDQPSNRDIFVDYVRDSYGLPAFARTTVRTIYGQARGKPTGWGDDFPGFMQRFGSNAAVTAIDGNVRYLMEVTFHEDLRYIPCHGCRIKAKIENSLLAEITARHDTDGHRFFTLTPTIADFSGPIIAHTLWYPGGPDPRAGAVSARLIFATRIGSHLFQEFVLERRHRDPEYVKPTRH